MSFSKLDEIFAQLIEDEIYEVRVTRKEILFITRWVIRNTSLSDVTPILTGAVDMFLGVKLIKIDEPSQRT